MNNHVYYIHDSLVKDVAFMNEFYNSACLDIITGDLVHRIGKLKACYSATRTEKLKDAYLLIETLQNRIEFLTSNKHSVFLENKKLKATVRNLRRQLVDAERHSSVPLVSIDWFGGESCP